MELYKRKLITEITKANIELMQIRIRTFRNKCDSYNKGSEFLLHDINTWKLGYVCMTEDEVRKRIQELDSIEK